MRAMTIDALAGYHMKSSEPKNLCSDPYAVNWNLCMVLDSTFSSFGTTTSYEIQVDSVSSRLIVSGVVHIYIVSCEHTYPPEGIIFIKTTVRHMWRYVHN